MKAKLISTLPGDELIDHLSKLSEEIDDTNSNAILSVKANNEDIAELHINTKKSKTTDHE